MSTQNPKNEIDEYIKDLPFVALAYVRADGTRVALSGAVGGLRSETLDSEEGSRTGGYAPLSRLSCSAEDT